MKYPYLLFDADDTLFDFPSASARAYDIMCRANEIPTSPAVYQLYHEINAVLWSAFDRGEVTKDFVTLERYVRFLKALNLDRDPAKCNRDYLTALGETGLSPAPRRSRLPGAGRPGPPDVHRYQRRGLRSAEPPETLRLRRFVSGRLHL